VRPCSKSGHFGQGPDDTQVDEFLGTVRIQRLGVESRLRAEEGGEHAHGMRCRREAIQYFLDILMNEGMGLYVMRKRFQLLAVGQVAKDQQVSDLFKRRFFSQVLDSISAVTEHTLVAIQEGNCALCSSGVFIAQVEGNRAGLLTQVTNINGDLILGALNDREFI